ncbi:hypothetical protein DR082_01550 [Mycoplasma flocculare]|nr:hypothetical protein [Mesomycoplasma flocculare]
MGIAELKQLAQIINLIKCKNIKLIFDIDIPNFIDLLEFRPFLIKPNVTELQKIFAHTGIPNFTWIKNSMYKL